MPFETCAPKLDAEGRGDDFFVAVEYVVVEVVGVVAAEEEPGAMAVVLEVGVGVGVRGGGVGKILEMELVHDRFCNWGMCWEVGCE